MSIQEEKKAVRHMIRGRLRKLTDKQVHEQSFKILHYLETSPFWRDCGSIFIFCSMPGLEPDTGIIIGKVLAEKRVVAVPRIDDRTDELVFKRITSLPSDQGNAEFQLHPYGFIQPASRLPDEIPNREALFILPGAAFSSSGRRLGHGGGYYDRYLSRIASGSGSNSGPVTVGIGFSCQLVEDLPIEDHDIHLGHLCTDAGWIHCDRH